MGVAPLVAGRVVGALLLVGLIASCSDDGSSADTANSTTTSSVAESSTSTISDPSTTSSPTTTIDAAEVEGPEEWVSVVVDVYARIHHLDTDPDPARVTEVYSENFENLEEERETIQFLADEGLHAEGKPPRVIRVEGPTEGDGSGSQQFVVTVEYFPFKLVREDGSVFEEIDDVPGEVQELLRISPSGADGAWRVLVKNTI